MKFRKRPIVVDAVQWFPPGDSELRYRHIEGVYIQAEDIAAHNGNYLIDTLEGPLRVSPGDWIIRGIKGELYPCKPDIFEATYEASEGG